MRDSALRELGKVAAVHHGLAIGRDLERLVGLVVTQITGLLEKPDVLVERNRDRAFADAADVVVTVLAAVPRLCHHVGEDEASLLTEDFLRDLSSAFHRLGIVGTQDTRIQSRWAFSYESIDEWPKAHL